MKHLALAILCTTAALAQYGGISSVADGSTIYFSSSFTLKGTERSSLERIYTFDGQDFKLHFGTASWRGTSVQVSDDGNVQVFWARGVCFGALACPNPLGDRPYSFLRIGDETFFFNGTLQLSRNGRYVLQSELDNIYGIWRRRWIDLQEGKIRDLPDGVSFQNTYAITNDGQALVSLPTGIALWKEDQVQTLDSCPLGWINPSGTHVITLCTRQVPVPNRTPILPLFRTVYDAYVLDVRTSSKSKFAEDVRPDASLALSEHYWLTTAGQLVTLATLASQQVSGNITSAWIPSSEQLLLSAGPEGLIRRSLPSGSTAVLIPPIPVQTGSQYRIFGVPGSVTLLPISQVTPGTRVTLAGQPLKSIVTDTGSLMVQIPWDTPPGTYEIEFETPPEVAFQAAPLSFPIFDWQPLIAPLFDWTNYFKQTPQADHFPFRPARAGELADVYLTGLGPVSNPPPYGERTPPEVSSAVLHAVEASLWETPTQRRIPVQVVSANLAAGLIGAYVVQVRLPKAQDLIPPPNGTTIPVVLDIGPPGKESGTASIAFDLIVR